MQNMEHFLADRALTLLYEARQFPQTASVSSAWLRQAEAWAWQHHKSSLHKTLVDYLNTIPSTSSSGGPA